MTPKGSRKDTEREPKAPTVCQKVIENTLKNYVQKRSVQGLAFGYSAQIAFWENLRWEIENVGTKIDAKTYQTSMSPPDLPSLNFRSAGKFRKHMLMFFGRFTKLIAFSVSAVAASC